MPVSDEGTSGRPGYFAMIPGEVIESGLDPISKVIYDWLVLRLSGRRNPSVRGYRLIAEALDFDEDTVADRLRRLADAGLIGLRRDGLRAVEVVLLHDPTRGRPGDDVTLPPIRPPEAQRRRGKRPPPVELASKGKSHPLPDAVGVGVTFDGEGASPPSDDTSTPPRRGRGGVTPEPDAVGVGSTPNAAVLRPPPRSGRGGGQQVTDPVGEGSGDRRHREPIPTASGTVTDPVGVGGGVPFGSYGGGCGDGPSKGAHTGEGDGAAAVRSRPPMVDEHGNPWTEPGDGIRTCRGCGAAFRTLKAVRGRCLECAGVGTLSPPTPRAAPPATEAPTSEAVALVAATFPQPTVVAVEGHEERPDPRGPRCATCGLYGVHRPGMPEVSDDEICKCPFWE